MEMNRVFIVGGLRSHIGLKNGIFRHIPAEKLGAAVLSKVTERNTELTVDEIICGNATGTGGNISRLMALYAGLAEEIPAYTVDMQCASSLSCTAAAFAKIRSGLADCIISGGFESSSLQPTRLYNENDPRSRHKPGGYLCAQFSPGETDENAMLKGAERVAVKESVSKAEMDSSVLESHRRAVKAYKSGILKDIICPVFGSSMDEGLRHRVSQRLLDRLPPLLGNGGLINAANTCSINDGAAFLVLCSESAAKLAGLKPEAEIVGECSVGCDPLYSPACAQEAAEKCVKKFGLTFSDISGFEFNESFAVIDVLFKRKYPCLTERYNRFGGALSYGHPYGATGAILLLHLIKSLGGKHGALGLCSAAAAGGLGSAILIRRP